MSGGGLSIGSIGLGNGSGFGGLLDAHALTACNYTSRPMARMSANALLCSTTPGRIR